MRNVLAKIKNCIKCFFIRHKKYNFEKNIIGYVSALETGNLALESGGNLAKLVTGITISINALSTGPTSGQAVVVSGGTAVQGPILTAINGVIVTAHPLNTPFTSTTGGVAGPSGVSNSVNGTGNGAFLQPGASVSFAVSNASVIWVNGFSGDKFSFAVS